MSLGVAWCRLVSLGVDLVSLGVDLVSVWASFLCMQNKTLKLQKRDSERTNL